MGAFKYVYVNPSQPFFPSEKIESELALTCSTLPNWYKRNPLFPKYSPLISTKTLHPKCMSHFKRKNAWAMMAKRKYQEEMSDEGSLKAVEDKKSKWQMRRATRNCWKLWNVSSHHYSNLSFRPWGHLNVGRKMWWQDNRLQHTWKNSANLHKMIMTVLKSLGS